jgi:dihydroneopterin aldolase
MAKALPARIVIERLECHAFHGWHPHEESFGQHFLLDLALSLDIARAAASDDLADAVDYGQVVATVRRLFVDRRYKLLEAAAAALGRGLLDAFPAIEKIELAVRKSAPPLPDKMASIGIDLVLTRTS